MAVNLRRPAIVVLILTLGTNALNYLRDAALAAQYGASPATDALFTALLVPAILQQMLVAGTLAPAVVPVYLELRSRSGFRARRFVVRVLAGTLLVLGTVIALAVALLPQLVPALLPGFDTATQLLTAQALQYLLPGALCLVLAGVVGVLLNAHHRFAWPAFVPAFSSLAALAVLAFVPGVTVGMLALAMALAMGLQLLVQLPLLTTSLRQPYDGPPAENQPAWLAAPVRRLVGLGVPLLVYASLAQMTTIIERTFASHLGEGAVARLTLAQKLSSLPLFLVAGSLAIVLFPRLAALSDHPAGFRTALSSGLRTTLSPLLLCTAWLVGASRLWVALLYQRGAFGAADTLQTAQLLAGYALGLTTAGIGAILLKALHARQDVRSPLWVLAVALGGYLVLASVLSRTMGAFGLALALSVTTVVSTALLGLVLVVRHHILDVRRLLGQLARLLPATVAAGIVAWAIDGALAVPLGSSFVALLGRAATVIVTSGLVFVLLAQLCGFDLIHLALRSPAAQPQSVNE
jgi:putative peptidoglycan lipid II flippase